MAVIDPELLSPHEALKSKGLRPGEFQHVLHIGCPHEALKSKGLRLLSRYLNASPAISPHEALKSKGLRLEPTLPIMSSNSPHEALKSKGLRPVVVAVVVIQHVSA